MTGRLAGPAGCGLAAIAVALAACGSSTHKQHPSAAPVTPAAPAQTASIRLQSPAFADRVWLPRRFTCDGAATSPPLSWSALPRGTRSLALLLEDPDAPGGTFLHWAVYRMPGRTDHLAAGRVPAGAVQGRNSFGKTGYGPPCPPKGARPHRYVFTLYALRAAPKLPPGAAPDEVRAPLVAEAAAKGVLTARYGR